MARINRPRMRGVTDVRWRQNSELLVSSVAKGLAAVLCGCRHRRRFLQSAANLPVSPPLPDVCLCRRNPRFSRTATHGVHCRDGRLCARPRPWATPYQAQVVIQAGGGTLRVLLSFQLAAAVSAPHAVAFAGAHSPGDELYLFSSPLPVHPPVALPPVLSSFLPCGTASLAPQPWGL